MKKLILSILFTMLVISGCGPSQVKVVVDKVPGFIKGEESNFILKVTEGDELKTGLSITATLEMAKMDHGVIEVSFEEVGKGYYKGEVTLPMGGDWIADIQIDSSDSLIEEVVTIKVEEG